MTKNIVFTTFLVFSFCISCNTQTPKTDSIPLLSYKEFMDMMSFGKIARERDSLQHKDALEFNLKVLPNDTLIGGKKYYPLILDSKNNLSNERKYYFNYSLEGIFLYSLYNQISLSETFLRFDNLPSDMVGTLLGRFNFFQLLRQSETEYNFKYIVDPTHNEISYMFGDKVSIKNKNNKQITIILQYHDNHGKMQKEFDIPFDNGEKSQ